MVRDKQDQPDKDRLEIEPTEGGPQAAGNGGQDDVAPDEQPAAESSESSGDRAADAGGAGDSAPERDQDSPPIAQPASGAASAADGLGETATEIVTPVELPPPAPLSPAAIDADSLIASTAEPAGISFGGFSPDAPAADVDASMHDLVERAPGSASSAIQQPFLLDTDPTRPRSPSHSELDDAPLDGRPGGPSTRQLSPLFVETRSGERRVQKRLEIEVEVTVINQDRIAQIASNKTLRTFSQLAATSVHKVAQDLRTFRESYRQAWGRRF